MNIPIYTPAELAGKLDDLRKPWHRNYLAMYSSLFDGIVTDPVLMVIPADDHLVHRADGVFDVFKAVNGRAYCLKEHMERLKGSASRIDMKLPERFPDLLGIIRATAQAGGCRDIMVRVVISRGPGGFSTNPYECPASQLYVIVTRLKKHAPEEYENGVPIISAPVPVKPPMFANIKSCDYLGNVLVKKAAIEAGVEFAVNWDEDGFLAEGSTENIMLVSPERELLMPEFGRVLKGITITRVLELAEKLVENGMLTAVRTDRIDRRMAARCQEVMLTGTSLDVLPVSSWDGRTVGDGQPGPVAKELLRILRDDIATNDELSTDLFG